MRTGANFARGSCRALKWLALFGVVFALGAGTALAQVVVTGPAQVTEEGTAEYTVTVEGYINTGANAEVVTVTLGTPMPDGGDATLAGDPQDISGNSKLTYTVDVPAAVPAATARAPFSATGTIEVRTTHDDDAEDEKFTLAFTLTDAGDLRDALSGGTTIVLVAGSPTALTIDDNETQGYDLTLDSGQSDLEEGDSVNLTLKPNPVHEDGTSTLALQLQAPTTGGYSISAPGTLSVTLNNATPATGVAITVATPSNDGNRDPDDIELFAHPAGGASVSSGTITLADKHVLPESSAITAVAYDESTGGNVVTSVVEDGEVYLEITVDRGTDGYPDAEAIEVALSLSDDSLATLGEEMVEGSRRHGRNEGPRARRAERRGAGHLPPGRDARREPHRERCDRRQRIGQRGGDTPHAHDHGRDAEAGLHPG